MEFHGEIPVVSRSDVPATSLRSPRCPKRWITARWIPWGYTVVAGDLSEMVRILEIISQHGTYSKILEDMLNIVKL